MKTKVLLLGSSGQLGQEIINQADDSVEFFSPTHYECDIARYVEVESTYLSIDPDIIINCAAYFDVLGAERQPRKAFETNSLGPWNIARAVESRSLTSRPPPLFIQISSDYVFGAKKNTHSYMENDIPCPINKYGWTKAMGEQWATQTYYGTIIVRTSALFGSRQGKNFLNTILAKADEQDIIQVVNDQHCSPTYISDLTWQITQICLAMFMDSPIRKIYHVINRGSCSWAYFAQKALEIAGKTTKIVGIPTPDQGVERPKYSILVNNYTKPMRHWEQALTEYFSDKGV